MSTSDRPEPAAAAGAADVAAAAAAVAAVVLDAADVAALVAELAAEDEDSCRTCTFAGAASVATGARKKRYLRLGIVAELRYFIALKRQTLSDRQPAKTCFEEL